MSSNLGHLLVVDDSPTVRKLVELTLRSTAWRVDFAADGAEAIRIATRDVPRVILLDVVLPDIPGFDVCAQLALNPRTADIPIILMSAKDETVRRLFSRYSSVVDFIQKPFTRDDLSASLLAASSRVRRPVRPESESLSTMSGRWPASEICSLVASSSRTGELVFHTARSSICIYFRCGEIVFATSLDPDDHIEWVGREIDTVDPDRLKIATRIQRESGKPFAVTLADQGDLPAAVDVGALTREVGRRLLREVLSTKEQTFEWRELSSLPPYVTAYGRQLPISKNASIDERDPNGLSPNLILQHASGIDGEKIELTVRARRVLNLIDGRMSLQMVASCAGLDIEYVQHIAQSLLASGLVVPREEARPMLALVEVFKGG